MAATAALEAVEPATGRTGHPALPARVLPAAAAPPGAVVLRQASVPAGSGQDKKTPFLLTSCLIVVGCGVRVEHVSKAANPPRAPKRSPRDRYSMLERR